jgi:hypothetical protein
VAADGLVVFGAVFGETRGWFFQGFTPAGSEEMMEPIARGAPRPRARMTGIVYLSFFLLAILGQLLVSNKLVTLGNAINVISAVCYAVLAVLFYLMFKPVSNWLSLLAALFNIAGCVVMTLGILDLVPSSFSPLWFFGPYCLFIGYLTYRSTFLPRLLGALMALAGVGWLAYLSPTLAHYLTLYIEIIGIVAEASLMLWLIVKGVNVARWEELASAS